MEKLFPYLIFNGNCQEALEFYKSVFKGKITKLQHFADAPIASPAGAEDRIFDSEIVAENFTIKASDSMPGQEISMGKNISLFLVFSETTQQQSVYNALAESGTITFELNQQSGFAMVEDQFGISWMLARK